MLTKKAHEKKRKGRVLVFILSLFLIFGTVSSAFAADNTWTTDPDTSSSYSGAFTSTADAGKVWTDKSVTDNKDGTAEVKLSALSETYTITGKTVTPTDTVFILDVSGSMTDAVSATDTTPRYQAMVTALNSAIKQLMEASPDNRIAVSAFSSTGGNTLMSLSHYDVADTYVSWGIGSGKTPYIYDGTGNKVSVTGGTNIQDGIGEGCKLLNNTSIVTSDGRKPIIVLLSDGEPTFVNDDSSWQSTSGYNTGAGRGAFAGNSFIALLMANYQKEQVSTHYSTQALFYTIGVGFNSLGTGTSTYSNYPQAQPNQSSLSTANAGNSKDLALMTLNPSGQLTSTSGNAFYNLINGYFNSYKNGSNFNVNIGTQNLFYGDWVFGNQNKSIRVFTPKFDSLGYNDKFFDSNDSDSLKNAFDSIVEDINKQSAARPTDGSVQLTDTIGDHVHVNADSLSLTYEGKSYKFALSGTEYKLDAENLPAALKDITVSIDSTANTITWNIPSAAIPMILASIKLNESEAFVSGTVTSADPITLTYNVALDDGISSSNIPSGMTADSQGYYNFYTNAWTAHGALTTAKFNPISPTETTTGNTYYYFSQNTQLYTDSNCTTELTGTPAAGTVYYYKESAYAISGTTLSEAADVILSGSWSEVPVSGITNGVAAKGTLKPTESTVNKAPNNTETSDYSSSAAVTAAGQATTKLGNNGRLQLKNTNATLAITGTKNILGGDWTDGQSFTFILEQVDENGADTTDPNVVLPDSTSVTTDKPESGSSQTFEFGNITFKAIGTYYFKVSETDPGIVGMTNAEAQIITVNVTKDDSTGILTATSTSSSALIFNNVYKHSLTVEKSVPGESGDKTKAFSMTILLEGPTGDTVDVAASGTDIADNKLTFTKQTDGTYKATVALADTQSVTLTGLDPRWKFSVAEDTYDGYTTTYKLDNVAYTSGTSTEVASSDHTVVVTNDRGTIVISGIEINKKDALYASIAVLTLAVGGSFYFISRKKARG